MAYGLRISRSGASEECYIAHNVHLCPDLAKKPNVKPKPAGLERAQNSKILGALPTRPRQNVSEIDSVFFNCIGMTRLASNTLSLTTGFRGRNSRAGVDRASRDAHWVKEEPPSVGRGPLLC